VDGHGRVLLAERLEVLLIVEVLCFQREPFGDSTARTDRLLLEPFSLRMAVAGDRPAVGTVRAHLVDATGLTMDTPIDAILDGVCFGMTEQSGPFYT